MNVKEILEAVRALSPEQRVHMRAFLDTPPGCWVKSYGVRQLVARATRRSR